VPLRKWIKSANFAIEGILHAAKTQRHLRYHFCSAAAVVFLSYAIGVSKTEFLVIALAVMSVLLAEMFNTAIEATVDILSPELREKARIAKDIAAGGVLITAFVAALIGYIILFPYIRGIFEKGPGIAKHSKEEISVLAFVIVLIVVVLMKSYLGKGHPLTGGMPSGHSALAFSVWMSVTYTTGSLFASAFSFVLAVAVAQSRVGTRVHSPCEVVAGGVIGALITFILFWVFS
jgi:diacylglycerol kinase (ATP)